MEERCRKYKHKRKSHIVEQRDEHRNRRKQGEEFRSICCIYEGAEPRLHR
uniref:Uncharacterized protein n=1 Tax=uncultured Bacteroidota bacterium TaxID=152509 RepID=H5SB13_9BACT|nr:hypothetical protein HGMM_F06F04C30 [uncultured Bacteroidetes bacterium]